jgi:hypothetical protein
MSVSHIFLFGHRKQHGKDTSVDILKGIFKEKRITHQSSYFAKMLKRHAADRYGLDFDRMNDDAYKNSRPSHLGGLTVRDVLIKEGCGARAIWQNTWAFPVYNEMLTSNSNVGLISDFRYPNEFECFEECYNIFEATGAIPCSRPKLIKVLVHKPTGKFNNDGADDQLPDIDPYWDFTIMNDVIGENWKKNLENQLRSMVKSTLGV